MKELAIVSTRTLNRSRRKQFEMTLQRPWKDSDADLYVAVHGQGPAELFDSQQVEGILELFEKDGTHTVGPFMVQILDILTEAYPFVGLLDDDADFPNPVESMRMYLERFKSDPLLGIAGPMSGFRFFRTHGNDPAKRIMPIQGLPWSTFGCQIYRSDCWRSIRHDLLKDIPCRLDVPTFMAAWIQGWHIEELVDRFNHTCSNIRVDEDQGEEWARKRLEQYDQDYLVSCDYLRQITAEDDDDQLTRLRLCLQDLDSIRRQMQRKTYKLAGMSGTTSSRKARSLCKEEPYFKHATLSKTRDELGLPSFEKRDANRFKGQAPWWDAEVLNRYASLAPAGSFILEVGTFLGRTANAMMRDSKADLIAMVGLWDAQAPYSRGKFKDLSAFEVLESQTKDLLQSGRGVPVKGDSRDTKTVEVVKDLVNPYSYGFVFINGDHTYEGCKTNLENYVLPLVPNRSYCAVHDYCPDFPGVVRAVNELLETGDFELVETTDRLAILWRN